jgi:uncharacterized membrane protein YqjE
MENRSAVASLVLGIVGVLFSMFALLSLPINIVGLVLGIFSKRNRVPNPLATAGITLSIIGLVFSIALPGLLIARSGTQSTQVVHAVLHK